MDLEVLEPKAERVAKGVVEVVQAAVETEGASQQSGIWIKKGSFR